MGYRLQQQQRQKTSIKLVYATTGIATMLIAFGAVFMFNIGNVRSALAGGTTTVVWEGKSSSDWNDRQNWKGGKLPENGDNIVITDKYKHDPVIADDSYFNVYDLNISKGAKLTIKANLEVKDDITIKGSKTQITVDKGELIVNDHIYIIEKGELVNNNGSIYLKDDLSIDEGEFSQSGAKAKFETADDIELSGDNSEIEINDGLVKVGLDFDFESGAKKAKQRLTINGGKVYIEGETRFYKTQSADETDQLVEINGGYVEFNEISRLGNTGTTYPGNYIFHITGGETHFNEDLIMNQWKNNPDFSSGSSSSSSSGGLGKQIGEYNLCKVLNIKKWNSGKYKRKNTEQIFVEYNSKIYRMKTGVYWSKNHEPDKSKSYWEEYTCTDLCKVDETWDSGETYKRDNGGDEVYVIHQGVLYDMKQDVWWSKNHEPGSNDGKKYWTELETCFGWSEEKCGSTSMWSSSKEYKRANSSDVIEVGYDGYIYSLKSNVWYSKNDNPSKSSSKWTKEKACSGSSSSSSSSSSGLLSGKSISTMLTSLVTTGEDEFIHEDGKVVFHKNWKRPTGFESKGKGIVHFKNSGKMNLQKGEKYMNLVIDNGVELEMEGDVEVKGDITNYSSKTPSCNSKWITLTGTGTQTITGDYALEFDNIKVNKSKGEVHLSQDLTVNGKITFSTETAIVAKEKSGNKTTTYPVITFEDDATWEGDGWFEGKVRKNGDDAFTFPTGKAGRKGYISITAPSGVSTYDAEYFAESPESGSVGTGLKNVSTKEYWSLEKISGNAVDVTLHWADGAYSGITDETEILVTEWDGSKWQTLGHDDHTGNTESGSVVAAQTPANYLYFTFGSNSNLVNALPVELISFDAQRAGIDVNLDWATASEKDNSHFEVHRSVDGVYFETIATVQGNGTTQSRINYQYVDVDAPSVKTYYRIKQVDFNGDFAYPGGIKVVYGEGETDGAVGLSIESVSPNPFISEINLNYKTGSSSQCQLIIANSSGNAVYEQFLNPYAGGNQETLQLGHLPQGYYIVQLIQDGKAQTTKILKAR